MVLASNVLGGGGGGRHPPYWLPAFIFSDANDSPVRAERQWGGTTPRWSLWLFSAAGYDYVSTEFLLPNHYSGQDITFTTYWAKDDAGAGNWRNINELVSIPVGSVITSGGIRKSCSQTLTVSAVVKTLQKDISIATSTGFKAGELLLVMTGRAGTSALDTYAGDILFLGVELDW